jgi:proteasome lid subunit RPN8/RPN11
VSACFAFLGEPESLPGRFGISTSDLRNIQKALKSTGKKIVGTFHSHPISEAVPSPSDSHRAKLNSLMLIYDVCGREIRLWKIKMKHSGKAYVEVPISPVPL